MANHRNIDWTVPLDADGSTSFDGASLAILMDIRQELRVLRNILQCRNFLDIPRKLDRIRKNTEKKKPTLKVVKRKVA